MAAFQDRKLINYSKKWTKMLFQQRSWNILDIYETILYDPRKTRYPKHPTTGNYLHTQLAYLLRDPKAICNKHFSEPRLKKFKMKGKSIFVVLLYLLPNLMSAQQIEAGLGAGFTNYVGDLNSIPDLSFNGFHIGYTGNIRYQYNPQFALRFQLTRGKITGSDRYYKDIPLDQSATSFTSALIDGYAAVSYHPFRKTRLKLYNSDGYEVDLAKAKQLKTVYNREGAKLNYEKGYFVTYPGSGDKLVYDQMGNLTIYDKLGNLLNRQFKPVISPFVYLGMGVAFTNPRVSGRSALAELMLEGPIQKVHFMVPLGGGIRYEFHPYWALTAEVGTRNPFSDQIDGNSKTRNPDSKDWYFYSGITLSYAIGNKQPPFISELDQDNDGVTDLFDQCPDVPGDVHLFGCPDSDGDRVMDSKDLCPNKYGAAEFSGCPDTDGDRLSDQLDNCPTIPGKSINRGCPDMNNKLTDKNLRLEQVREKNSYGHYEVYTQTKDTKVKNGYYTVVTENGQMIEKSFYVNDTLDGYRILYFENGNTQVVEHYKEGNFHGDFLSYFPGNKLQTRGRYEDNKMVGDWKYFYKDGRLKEVVQFNENMENGPFIEYHKNGQLKARGTYYEGDKRHGLLELFNESGELIEKQNCNYGKCKSFWKLKKE